MANRIYIAIIAFVLIGGASTFGYWSLGQFNAALNSFEASYTQLSASLAANSRLASETATTTDMVGLATTTSAVGIAFPAKGNDIYVGCTYQIFLQSSTTIHSLETALIDVGTGEASGPIASGLAREYEVKPDSQGLDWKVGPVWPGEYFVLLSKVNEADTATQSDHFTIQRTPKDISAGERKSICEESGGSL